MKQIEDLTKAVLDLQKEAKDLRESVQESAERQANRTTLLACLLVVFAVVGLLGAALLHQDIEEARRAADDRRSLRSVIAPLVPQPGDAPPGTERGREVAEGMRAVAEQFDCDQQ